MTKQIEQISRMLKNVDSLSEAELRNIAKTMSVILSNQNGKSNIGGNSDSFDISDDTNLVCPYCFKENYQGWGYYDGNKKVRRYKCKDCNKTFRRTTNTVIAHSHKSLNDWEKFIALTLKGATLAKCAKECGICINTASAWRQKLLSALASAQSNCVMSGIVEMDETFFRLNYKGNHTKSKTFTMPRKAFKRGTPRKYMSEQVAVICAAERNRQVYSELACRGSITKKLLDKMLPSHLANDSVVLTDGHLAYKAYFKTAPQKHIRKNAKAKNKGVYHINNINNYHNRLKVFIGHYKGVSTKYLNNYVALFSWVENMRLSAKNENKATVGKVLEIGNYRKAKEFGAWAHEPDFAPAA